MSMKWNFTLRLISLLLFLIVFAGCDGLGDGILVVSSTPSGAKVYLGDSYVGLTPVEIPLPEGKHQIVVRKDGFEEWSSAVLIKSGSTQELTADLKPLMGAVLIEVEPTGAMVAIDGIRYEAFRELTLAPGQHEVVLSQPGYSTWKSVITVDVDKRTHINVTLAQEMDEVTKYELESRVVTLIDQLLQSLTPDAATVIHVQGQDIYIDLAEGLVRVGQVFELVQLGEQVVHSETGRVLGKTEESVGFVQVKRVRDEFAIAEPVGTLKSSPQIGNRVFPVHDEHTIAVSQLSTLGGSETTLSAILQDMLINDLSGRKGLKVIERQQLDRVVNELKLGYTGLIDQTSAKEVGKILGVDLIAIGSIVEISNTLEINARLVDVQTGGLLSSATMVLPRDDVFLALLAKSEKADTIQITEPGLLPSFDVTQRFEQKMVLTDQKSILEYMRELGQERKYKEAIDVGHEAVAVFPDDPWIHRELVIVYQGGNNLNDAKKFYEELIRENPNNVNALVGLGRVFNYMDLPSESNSYLFKALGVGIKDNTTRATAENMIGSNYQKMYTDEKSTIYRDKSIEYYEKAKNSDPTLYFPYENLVYIYEGVRFDDYTDYEKLIHTAQQAIRTVDPSNGYLLEEGWKGRFYSFMGYGQVKQSKYRQAITNLKVTHEIYQSHPNDPNNNGWNEAVLGWAYKETGEKYLAISFLEKAFARVEEMGWHPDDVSWYKFYRDLLRELRGY